MAPSDEKAIINAMFRWGYNYNIPIREADRLSMEGRLEVHLLDICDPSDPPVYRE